jgi:hypothetical protein
MLQLNPPIYLETPKGPAMAYMVVDYGVDYDLIWVCFIKETGECWSFRNPQVRQAENITMGRYPKGRTIKAK